MPIPSRGQLGQMANPQFQDPAQARNLAGFPAGAKPKPMPPQGGFARPQGPGLPPPQPGMPGMGPSGQIPPGMTPGSQYGNAREVLFNNLFTQPAQNMRGPQPGQIGPLQRLGGQPGQKPMQPMPGTLTAAGQPQPWQPYAGQPPQAGPSRVPPGMPQGPQQKPPGQGGNQMPNLGTVPPGGLGGGK